MHLSDVDAARLAQAIRSRPRGSVAWGIARGRLEDEITIAAGNVRDVQLVPSGVTMVSPLGQHVAAGERILTVGSLECRSIAKPPASLTGRRAVVRRQWGYLYRS